MYVIKNNRMKRYLYSLGFNFKEQKDRTGRTNKVYIFKNSELLQQAISFYTNFKKKMY